MLIVCRVSCVECRVLAFWSSLFLPADRPSAIGHRTSSTSPFIPTAPVPKARIETPKEMAEHEHELEPGQNQNQDGTDFSSSRPLALVLVPTFLLLFFYLIFFRT